MFVISVFGFLYLQQTNTAEMLDLAVEYIKDLQEQVQVGTWIYIGKTPMFLPTNQFSLDTKQLTLLLKFYFSDALRQQIKVRVLEKADAIASIWYSWTNLDEYF